MQTLVFLFSQKEDIQNLLEIQEIADAVLIEGRHEKLPLKFQLCKEAVVSILTAQGVTREQFIGLMDTVGGYFCALHAYKTHHGGLKRDMNRAADLVKFVQSLVEQAREVWQLGDMKDLHVSRGDECPHGFDTTQEPCVLCTRDLANKLK
jgi:uncharacterized protein YjiS (DUF1127 family)